MSNPFDGQPADTIALTSSLPAIKDPVHIVRQRWGLLRRRRGPTNRAPGVDGTVGGPSALIGRRRQRSRYRRPLNHRPAQYGRINVIDSSSEFRRCASTGSASSSTVTPAGNNKGIFLDPDSYKATIGGVNAADRNVIANNSFEGLDIDGADEADVLGNYFGVDPDGATRAANGKNVEITDTIAFDANDNEVGTTVEGAAVTTQAAMGAAT